MTRQEFTILFLLISPVAGFGPLVHRQQRPLTRQHVSTDVIQPKESTTTKEDDWVTDAFNTHAEWLEDVELPVRRHRIHADWFDEALENYHPTLLPAVGPVVRMHDHHELFTVAMDDFVPTPLQPAHRTGGPQEWFTQAMQDFSPVTMPQKQGNTQSHADWFMNAMKDFQAPPVRQTPPAFDPQAPNEWFSQVIA